MRWVRQQSLCSKKIFFFLIIPILSGIVTAVLIYVHFNSPNDLSENPYSYYDKTITARIGAYAPYAYLDKGGFLDGYVIDLTHAISRVMSARIVLLSRKLNDPQEYASLNDADVVLCMVKTDATSKIYDFSPPYAIHSFTIFAHKNAIPLTSSKHILENPKIVLNEDGVYYDLNRSKLNHFSPATVSTAEEALYKVSQEEFDYVVLESYIGEQYIEKNRLDNIIPLKELDEKVEYAFATRKGNTEVLKIFNEGMTYLRRTGQFDKIQKRWLEKRFLYTKSDRDAVIFYIILGLLISSGIMLTIFIWSYTQKKLVKERTSDLENEIENRKKIEQKLIFSQAQLLQADKMAAVGTLASGVAHEINNPNGLILLNMDFLKQAYADMQPMIQYYCENVDEVPQIAGLPCDALQEHMTPILDDTMQASLRIKNIVEDMKDFARPESADWEEKFNLNEVIKAALRLLKNMIKNCTDSFHISYGQNLPLMQGSAQKIEQVFLNLVINACQAIQDREQKVEIKTEYNFIMREICLTVRDEGEGIDPHDMSSLFDPFFTTKREHGGTGLGLSICDTIVKAHHGTLEIQSELDKGTTVVVRLPVTPSCLKSEEHNDKNT